jgi:plasmid stabilization system protein ParE
MPSSWSSKDERKYEHIKEGYEERGVSEDRAEEIAARTVNKERREEGRTRNGTTQGTGNPRTSLEARTRDELENIAADEGISGRSRMKKDELVKAIRRKR